MLTRITGAILILLVSLNIGTTAPTIRTILLKVNSPKTVWHDAHIEQHIIRPFTTQDDIRVIDCSTLPNTYPAFPADQYNLDALIGWGQEVGGRYLLFVDISSEHLERRKSFHVPLFFHKYETVGVITGNVRVIDLTRGKQLLAEPFKVEKKGPRIFQATMDDDINDPDVHLTSPDKLRFFDELEAEAGKQIIKKTRAVIGRREIDRSLGMR